MSVYVFVIGRLSDIPVYCFGLVFVCTSLGDEMTPFSHAMYFSILPVPMFPTVSQVTCART